MGLFSRWRKSSRKTNNIVDEYVIRGLIDKHWSCRSFQKGALRGTALYRGIVYRGDPGWANNGMQYFFDNGFTQQHEQNVDWEKFSGKFAGGHTGKVGISTTTDYDYAADWAPTDVYVIDLSRHPFAYDVNKSGLAAPNPADRYHVEPVQCEINVANWINAEMIFGHYNRNTRVFTKNPKYEGALVL
ncbi:hypothetical protein B6A42_26810 (plasmid) [Vibrio coralliilyticus]|jgi:hypothetical protein|uniref:hypothetical protein n=1 Tax=Vibrio TaxID=662 RepID=UPI00050389C9|nr:MULTISPECIES: hypothetical protein [Vibrio]ANW25161.1 hypothetical protein BA953_13700 [Vibrio coralliilyticus]ARC95034.1 hypothetical protein B6A42_26810 [Vibrio coralliilyticus]KFI13924.1 hypothetical protein IX95_01590 [Vibrio sp. B183]NOI19590.1 hypothetical protein [Vibrio coralliilyticus]